jgi:hypothetical protein
VGFVPLSVPPLLPLLVGPASCPFVSLSISTPPLSYLLHLGSISVTPCFHPVSSCSWQWLGVLWWWWVVGIVLKCCVVNQQGHMTTHLTGKLVTGIPVHTHDTLSWVYPYPCHALVEKQATSLIHRLTECLHHD